MNTKKYILNIFFILLFVIILLFCTKMDSFAVGVAHSADIRNALKAFRKEYKFYLNVFVGFIVLSNILIFIYHFFRLGAVATNPQERKKTINDLIICGVCLALIGGGAVIIYILFFLAN